MVPDPLTVVRHLIPLVYLQRQPGDCLTDQVRRLPHTGERQRLLGINTFPAVGVVVAAQPSRQPLLFGEQPCGNGWNNLGHAVLRDDNLGARLH